MQETRSDRTLEEYTVQGCRKLDRYRTLEEYTVQGCRKLERYRTLEEYRGAGN